MEKRVVVLTLFAILSSSLVYGASTNSSNYKAYIVLPSAGEKSNTSTYNIYSVIGQPIVGLTNTSIYNAWLGFFYSSYYKINHPPTTPTLSAPANSSRQIGNLANLTYSATDADGDTITYTVVGDTSADPTTTLYTGTNEFYEWSTADGRTYYWKVKAADGTEESGFSGTWSFTENNLTVQGTPQITPSTPTSSENISCEPNSVFDSDTDSITFAHNWKRNGGSITVLNMPFDYNASIKNRQVRDFSGYGNNGTIYGAAWNSSGKLGGAYSFDGGDYIDCGAGTSLNLTTMSITAWVKLNSNNTDTNVGQVIAASYSGYKGYIFYLKGTGATLGFRLHNGTATCGDALSSGNLNLGKWYFVAGTYNGSKITVYINGSENASASCYNPIGRAAFVIGKASWSNTNYLNGTIDDIRLYNHSLTAAQIYQIYNETAEGKNTSTIVSDETIKGESWNCSVTPIDGYEAGATKTAHVTIGNSLPGAPSLIAPANDSTTTNRTLLFNWTAATDPDNDPLDYNIVIDNNSDFSSPEYNITGISATNYTNPDYLNVSTTYWWKVRANDSSGYGVYSQTFNFTILEVVSLVLNVNQVDFKSLQPWQSNDTTDNSPPPFRIENNGNVNINVSVLANQSLFEKAGLGERYFQAEADEYESGCYDTSRTNTTWINLTATYQQLITGLEWNNSKDEAEIELRVEVPEGEPSKAEVRAKINISGVG